MTQINNMNAVDAAQTRISEIENAIINGDSKLTSTDLRGAKDALDFAKLQDAAKRRAEEKAVDAARRGELLKIEKKLAELANARPAIEKQFASFEKSLTDYLSAVVVYHKGLNSVRGELRDGGFLKDTMPGPIEGIPTENGRTVQIGEIAANGIQPQEEIKLLTERLLGEFNQNLRG